MLSCNLIEIFHNKWLQQSSNCNSNLYVATMDDFIEAFMWVMRFYQYLKGNQLGNGLGKEKLQLRVA
jgi:hypothetical protein